MFCYSKDGFFRHITKHHKKIRNHSFLFFQTTFNIGGQSLIKQEHDHGPLSLFADLKNRPVLLAGAGKVAERKAESLLSAGARVRVVAETFESSVSAMGG